MTDADILCWRFPARKVGFSAHLFLQSLQSDRRDSDLLLYARRNWFVTALGDMHTRARLDIRGTDSVNRLRAPLRPDVDDYA